jgi:hypothetical protein
MEVKTRQRADLRWVFSIDGEDSETTYPTAGEAERGALAAVTARRAAQAAKEPWKWMLVVAAGVVPVVWFLVQLVRMLTQ